MNFRLDQFLLRMDQKPALLPILISSLGILLAITLASVLVALGLNENGSLFILSAGVIAICVAVPAGYTHYRRDKQIEAQRERLRTLASTDDLTGALNRRSFEAAIQAEQRRMDLTGEAAAVILFDLDWFKSINDTFGHAAGDKVLTHVAASARAALRQPGDAIARWGGEEFAIFLTGVTIDQAFVIADRLRQSIADTPLTDIAPGLSVTGSFGVAAMTARSNFTKIMADADRALYQAKEAGRNTAKISTLLPQHPQKSAALDPVGSH